MKDLTKGYPAKVIMMFAIPLIFGQIMQQFYNMADTIIVGRFVGAGALAAVGSTGTIMFLINGFAQGVTSGFSILTSQRFGAQDPQGVRRSVANGVLLSLAAMVILTALCMAVMRPLLGMMNTPEDIFYDAGVYLKIYFMGLPFLFMYNIMYSGF